MHHRSHDWGLPGGGSASGGIGQPPPDTWDTIEYSQQAVGTHPYWNAFLFYICFPCPTRHLRLLFQVCSRRNLFHEIILPFLKNLRYYIDSFISFVGIYKVPIDNVGEALFEALIKFDESVSGSSSLREIHIVDISSLNICAISATLGLKLHRVTSTSF